MVWGQIDSPSNYAGWMNHAYTYFSGSGGGNTRTHVWYMLIPILIYILLLRIMLTANSITITLGNAQTFPTGYAETLVVVGEMYPAYSQETVILQVADWLVEDSN